MPSFPSLQDMPEILAIGDIHGRLDLLEGIAAKIDARTESPSCLELYLGDYIDRGPCSRQVIDFLIDRQSRRPMICLAGNHEEMLLEALDGRHLAAWAKLGGGPTAFSYGLKPAILSSLAPEDAAKALRDEVPATHIEFIRNMPLWHQDGDYIFVHAGLRPGLPPEQQSRRDLLWIRDSFLKHRGSFGGVVIHGHTPVREPDFRPNRINIDTGAYMSNRLTCLSITSAGASIFHQT
jgi:serine/threonine protein phosphatase 1